MPVTVKPAPHGAHAWTQSRPAKSASELFRESCPKHFEKSKGILQSSFPGLSSNDSVYPSQNGFVLGAIKAYSHHHHLVLRPEDIWFSILTQLSFYINAHAEELRSFFVPHEGQEELWIECQNVNRADFAVLAQAMTHLISKKVNDPDLRDFVMPDFSTTTETDRAVASILFMGSLQAYFKFGFRSMCGIPSVTLQGERGDWEKMLLRLEKLPQLGKEPTQFYNLLKPVLSRFVRTFDEPENDDIVDFWAKIAHERRGSGTHTLSGWLTAFCFWNGEGICMYNVRESSQAAALCLDGAYYHTFSMERLPKGWASVPVKLDHHGLITDTVMVAGIMGIQAKSSGEILDNSRTDWRGTRIEAGTESEPKTGLDTINPIAGWFMYKLEEPYRQDEKEEEVVVSPHASLPPRMKTGVGKDSVGKGRDDIKTSNEVETRG